MGRQAERARGATRSRGLWLGDALEPAALPPVGADVGGAGSAPGVQGRGRWAGAPEGVKVEDLLREEALDVSVLRRGGGALLATGRASSWASARHCCGFWQESVGSATAPRGEDSGSRAWRGRTSTVARGEWAARGVVLVAGGRETRRRRAFRLPAVLPEGDVTRD